MKRIVMIGVLAMAAACSPAAPPADETPVPIETTAPAEAPPEVLTVIRAEDPDFAVSESIEDATTGARTFEVTGASGNGVLRTYNVMHFNEGWRIVQIRRDIAWADAPASVRNAVATSPSAIVPAKVVEVHEPGADGVMYELWGDAPEALLLTVRDVDGQAAIMPAPH